MAWRPQAASAHPSAARADVYGPKATAAVTVDGWSADDIQRAIDLLHDGGIVHLAPGRYELQATVQLPSNVAIVGAGPGSTEIVLSPGASCHMFTNADHRRGNEHIRLSGMSLDGDMANQHRSDGHPLSFADGGYFKNVQHIVIEAITASRIRQTAFHLSHCTHVRITDLASRQMGWSGISTSGTDDIVIRNVSVVDSGLDVRHSGIHLDGGSGAYVDALVDGCSGNGIMLDSRYAALNNVVVDSVARRARRGLSMSGAPTTQLSDIFVTGCYSDNDECGLLITNTRNAFIVDALIAGNREHGIVLQGSDLTQHCVIADCRIIDNPIAIQERHGTRASYETGNVIMERRAAPAIPDLKTLTRRAYRTGRSRFGTSRLGAPARRLGSAVRRGAQGARGVVSGARRTSPRPVPERPPSAASQLDPASSFTGTCRVCGASQEFVLKAPSIREGFRCPGCRAHLRYQGQADVLLRRYAPEGASSLAELVAEPSFRQLDVYEPGVLGALRPYLRTLPRYVASDYWPDVALGDSRDGVRCEDLMALSMPSDSFDLVVTSDIFEHVRHPYTGFAEVHRVLRPGGAHVFSIPVQHPMRKGTVERIDTSGDEDVHILEPRYHLGPNNSRHIVYNDFGEDLIDQLAGVGFATEVVRFESPNRDAAKLLTFCSVKTS